MQINIIKVRTVGVFPFREIHLAERDETKKRKAATMEIKSRVHASVSQKH